MNRIHGKGNLTFCLNIQRKLLFNLLQIVRSKFVVMIQYLQVK